MIGQIKLAFANPLPLVIGVVIGALVPIATYTVGHAELDTAGWGSVPGAVVIGGCIFSAITVYKWGRRAFDSVQPGSPRAASGRSAKTTRTSSTAGPSTSRAGSHSWGVSGARALSWERQSATKD